MAIVNFGWRINYGLVFLLALVFTGTEVQAQSTNAPYLFSGKTVGVYISKRNLSFTGPYYTTMAAYLQKNDSLGLAYEEIRLGVTIKLGNYLVRMLKQKMQADSVYFINADPPLAGVFVQNYFQGKLNFAAVNKALPPKTDMILAIDAFDLSGQDRPVVYNISDQLVTDLRYVHLAHLAGHVFDVQNKTPAMQADFHYDQDTTPDQNIYFSPEPYAPPAERIFASVFNPFFYTLFTSPR